MGRVKRVAVILLSSAALIGTVGIGSNSASANARSAASPSVRLYYAIGPIRPADNSHWCLTENRPPKDRERVFWALCVKYRNSYLASQLWASYMVQGVGAISFVFDMNVFELGWKANRLRDYAARIFTRPDTGPTVDTILHITEFGKGYKVFILQGKRPNERAWFLTAPAHLKARKMLYIAYWRAVKSPSTQTQEFLFEPWHEVTEKSVAAATAAGKRWIHLTS